MVRRMNGAGCIVHEEGLVRRHRLLGLDPVDRLVGHIHGEVIALRVRRRDSGSAVIDQRVPLIRLAPDKAIELVEPLVGGPAIEGPRHTGFPRCGFMPLAERAGAVSVESQHLGQRCHAVRNLPGVAGKSR